MKVTLLPTLAAVSLLALLARPAAAEPATEKSGDDALALSGGVTLLSGILVAATADADRLSPMTAAGAIGLTIGPSLGHLYAGEYLTWGMGLRAAGLATAILGYRAASCGRTGDCDAPAGTAAMLVGGAAFAAGVIWDVATARRAADRWNALVVAPAVTDDGAGVSLQGVF